MYSVKPIGLNIKDNDRDVPDGSLQESINMQWRDGAFKPIPERLISEIYTEGYSHIILHKVGDENQINVLGFNEGVRLGVFLAMDVVGYLGGTTSTGNNKLNWFGTISNGVYTPQEAIEIDFTRTAGMSFTILNGLIYFMGDGSSTSEQYYIKLEFNEESGSYKLYDMYKWKTLIPFYPIQDNISQIAPKNSYNLFTTCGLFLVRFALVLKSGEVVLHSPAYCCILYSLNRSASAYAVGDVLKNIHSFVNLNLSFEDSTLFDDEIVAINLYATTPFYVNKIISVNAVAEFHTMTQLTDSNIKGELATKAEEPFYLVKTFDKSTTDKVLFTIGDYESDIVLKTTDEFIFSKIDLNTVAAGEVMPVDNFSYQKLFGKITSYNGRLVIKRPSTVLSGGHMRSLALLTAESDTAFKMTTEDGDLNGISYRIDKALQYLTDTEDGVYFYARGIVSYPDARAYSVGLNDATTNDIKFIKVRKNALHNMASSFNFYFVYESNTIQEYPADHSKAEFYSNYTLHISYLEGSDEVAPSVSDSNVKYTSENRIQFSQTGEFKVWPALNSYRIGEGKVMSLGIGSVNPSESQVISPIIIGTTDGIYTINLDPMGNNFIASITKTKNIPFISEEILEIDNNIIFVSDKGLMVFSNGDLQNLTEAYFSQQGNGNFPNPESVFGGYDLLTADFFGPYGNPYSFDDIIAYMKGALMAFDGRRDNIWCCNPTYNFSMVFNLTTKQWGISTLVFYEKPELFSILETAEGEIYSRFLIKSPLSNNLLILSGENPSQEVFYHILTRPIKFESVDDYKNLKRMVSRTMLTRDTSDGYLSFGLWGQQEVNKRKKSIPIALKKDNRSTVFPNGIRYHIPVDCRKGKYKAITVLQSGKVLPDSYISSFDFDIYLLDNNRLR